MNQQQMYFANKDGEDLVTDCMAHIVAWNNAIGTGSEGIAGVWFRNIRYYYSNIISGGGYDSSLEYGGVQGELVKMFVPQARSLNQQFMSLTTKQKLAFQPVSLSKDMSSLNATRLGAGLSQKIVRDQKLDLKAVNLAEHTSLCGMGYLSSTWDFLKGKPKAVDFDNKIMYSGALSIDNPLPTEVIFDFTKPDFYDNDWVIIRRPRNKWDLVQRYPGMEDDILRLDPVWKASDNMVFWYSKISDDYVWVYELYHRTSAAVEDGRMTIFGGQKCIFEDGPNPYKNEHGAYIPVSQMKPESIMGTGFGYPIFSNILPMQEMLDHQFSAFATNNAANAVQSVLNPYGNDLSVKNIQGLRFVQYRPFGENGGGKPEPLQLTASSPESYKFAEMLRSYMMEIYNVSAALRGQPPPGVTAAKAIATLTTNAIEFAQSFSKAYIDCISDAMTKAFYAYKIFADKTVMVEDLGSYNKGLQREFKKSDIAAISRVDMQVSNPLMATAAGRYDLAESLASKGMLPNIQAYFRVLEGAPPDVLYEDEFDQENFIAQENEDLKEGRPVFALQDIDIHAKHIKGHAKLLSNTGARRDADFTKRVLDHISEHYSLLQQEDPNMLGIMVTGQGQPGQGMPPQGAGAPPPPGLPPPREAPAENGEPLVDIGNIPLTQPSQGA